MNDYQNFMKTQEYYIKHQEYLESYLVTGWLMSIGRFAGFRRLWATDMNQIGWY